MMMMMMMMMAQMDQMMNLKKTKMRLKMMTRFWTMTKPLRKPKTERRAKKMERMPKRSVANGSTKIMKMPRKERRKHHLLPPKNRNQLRMTTERRKHRDKAENRKIRQPMRLAATGIVIKPMANPRPLPKINEVWLLKIILLTLQR